MTFPSKSIPFWILTLTFGSNISCRTSTQNVVMGDAVETTDSKPGMQLRPDFLGMAPNLYLSFRPTNKLGIEEDLMMLKLSTKTEYGQWLHLRGSKVERTSIIYSQLLNGQVINFKSERLYSKSKDTRDPYSYFSSVGNLKLHSPLQMQQPIYSVLPAGLEQPQQFATPYFYEASLYSPVFKEGNDTDEFARDLKIYVTPYIEFYYSSPIERIELGTRVNDIGESEKVIGRLVKDQVAYSIRVRLLANGICEMQVIPTAARSSYSPVKLPPPSYLQWTYEKNETGAESISIIFPKWNGFYADNGEFFEPTKEFIDETEVVRTPAGISLMMNGEAADGPKRELKMSLMDAARFKTAQELNAATVKSFDRFIQQSQIAFPMRVR
jgi:hypothetical protein